MEVWTLVPVRPPPAPERVPWQLGERQLARQDGVALYDREDKTEYENGVAIVSTHRLLWLREQTLLAVPLSTIANVSVVTGMQVRLMNRSPKLVIVFEPTARGATSPAPPTPAASTPADVRTPAMAQLQDMFPGASASLIAAALAVSGQDVEQAVSALLEADNPSLQQALLARARATPAHPAAPTGTPASPLPPPPRSPGLPFCKLSFRSGGLPVIQQALARAMEERLWEQVPNVPIAKAMPVVAGGPSGGIASILQYHDDQNRQVMRTLDDSFSDLRALMAKASDLVKTAQRLSDKVGTGNAGNPDPEAQQLGAYLLSMGIANPVTKQTAGGNYSTELAKELAAFLRDLLPRHNGIMTLFDVYCFFNRARGGGALISPNDLVTATEQLGRLGLGVILRRTASGVPVVQLANFRDDAVAEHIRQVAAAEGSVSAEELARLDRISPVLAHELLLAAEALGTICRDDTMEGLRFFENLFLVS